MLKPEHPDQCPCVGCEDWRWYQAVLEASKAEGSGKDFLETLKGAKEIRGTRCNFSRAVESIQHLLKEEK